MKVVLSALVLAAVLCGCTTGASASASPPPGGASVSLSTDISVYSPLMSSAFGIHIFAKDGTGDAVTGKWTATWGQFCTATPLEGGWKVGEGKEEWDGASDIWWQFSPEPTPNGEMPSSVSITFEGGGSTQTLLLEKSGPMTLKVSGAGATASPQR